MYVRLNSYILLISPKLYIIPTWNSCPRKLVSFVLLLILLSGSMNWLVWHLTEYNLSEVNHYNNLCKFIWCVKWTLSTIPYLLLTFLSLSVCIFETLLVNGVFLWIGEGKIIVKHQSEVERRPIMSFLIQYSHLPHISNVASFKWVNTLSQTKPIVFVFFKSERLCWSNHIYADDC